MERCRHGLQRAAAFAFRTGLASMGPAVSTGNERLALVDCSGDVSFTLSGASIVRALRFGVLRFLDIVFF